MSTDTVGYRPKPGEVPTAPGVYRFRDATRRVLYVGKAKNLRARLSNYFAPLPSLHERTRRMVTTATSVEWTVVGNEYEALQLEFSWIKEFDPPFNVKFRDDKTYPYLAVTVADEVPRVLITRNHNIPGARYFGPYTKVWAIRETLDLMLKVFPMRSCTDGVFKRAQQTGRPCLLADIGRCVAPCVGRVTIAEHRQVVDDFVSFMSGNDTRFIQGLTAKMNQAAEAQDYEAAARHRDNIQALTAVMEKTAIVLADSVDADVFGIVDDELAAAVQLFIVRGGRIRGVRSWVVDKELDIDQSELIETALQNAYQQLVPPREVLVPVLPADQKELETWLGERRSLDSGKEGRRVRLRVPQRGDTAALAQTVRANAANAFMLYKTRRTADFVARSQALSDIQEALGLAQAPLRMECFDVSHLSGTNIVASMVVFEDGLPRKDHYRRFNIPESTDDTDSIHQVISRRVAYLTTDEQAPGVAGIENGTGKPGGTGEAGDMVVTGGDGTTVIETAVVPVAPGRFSYRPNLLIVDGGQPQVQAAARALREAGITDIALCGIAKRLEEIWLPDSEYPVILPRNSDALFLIQRIRDEAHRFAISFQRSRRRRDINTVLGEIPGVGPARVKALLQHFGSVARLKQAEVDQIGQVPGIGPSLAETIHRHLSATPAP
ncbi:excinuclease ABC subunit UvrC [Homoserinimonas sp. OAct 916]|uniref:excinuclease ABC subunit UvrC n=1 Tax=Homoserinimonas sp. OAct 916 TaxID=2211450 RepID=UPI000DBE0AD0|nr:excinuclease ABC subunit UvrC [Homoserinimonas sp. OAct 916]